MKNEDVQVGMKVVPHQKTADGWEGLEYSHLWQEAKNSDSPYLYVQEWDKDGYWVLGPECDARTAGDFFNAEDFELYDNSWIDEKITKLQSEIKSLRQLKRKHEKG